MEINKTIRIERSADFIFKVLKDLENLPVWQIFDMQVAGLPQEKPVLAVPTTW